MIEIKITFLIPPAVDRAPERIFGCNYGVYPETNIFMLYPAAILEKEGHEVKFIDCPNEKKDEKWFDNFLENDDSDVYVFYTVFLAEKTDKYAIEKIRKYNKNVYIVFMGPEPSSRSEDFLKFTDDDRIFIVRGETEYTTKELIETLENKKDFEKILGLSWKNKGKTIHNPARPLTDDLDKLPFPARHLVSDPSIYYNPKLKGRPMTVILTSRGCFGQCIFCIPCSYSFAREIEYRHHHQREKPPGRFRSAKNVIEEFKLIKKQGYKAVAIIDDNFIWGKERLLEICNGIKGLNLEWGCLTRADTIKDKEMTDALAEAGCKWVDLGTETLNKKCLEYTKKGMKVEDNLKAIKLLKESGVIPKINILLGACPYETEENIKKMVNDLIKANASYVTFGIVIPHPETPYYEIVKKNNWFVTRSKDYVPADPLEASTFSLPNISAKGYESLVRWCYRKFYLRPMFIFNILKEIKTPREFLESVKTGWNLVFKKESFNE